MSDLPASAYRRDLRPPIPESLGEHVDREFAKIEAAIELLRQQIANLSTAP